MNDSEEIDARAGHNSPIYREAYQAYLSGRYSQAVQILREQASATVVSMPVATLFATCLAYSCKYAEAEAYLKEQLDKNPRNPRLMLLRAHNFQHAGNTKEYCRILLSITNLQLDDRSSMLASVELDIKDGRFENAYSTLKKIPEQRVNTKSDDLAVTILLKLNRIDEADDISQKMMEQNPNSVFSLLCRSSVLWHKHRKNESLSCLERAQQLSPQNERIESELIRRNLMLFRFKRAFELVRDIFKRRLHP